MSHGSTPLTHGGNADEEREGRRSVAAGYHADRHDGTRTPSRHTTYHINHHNHSPPHILPFITDIRRRDTETITTASRDS